MRPVTRSSRLAVARTAWPRRSTAGHQPARLGALAAAAVLAAASVPAIANPGSPAAAPRGAARPAATAAVSRPAAATAGTLRAVAIGSGQQADESFAVTELVS
jgi:hypothetical protein